MCLYFIDVYEKRHHEYKGRKAGVLLCKTARKCSEWRPCKPNEEGYETPKKTRHPFKCEFCEFGQEWCRSHGGPVPLPPQTGFRLAQGVSKGHEDKLIVPPSVKRRLPADRPDLSDTELDYCVTAPTRGTAPAVEMPNMSNR